MSFLTRVATRQVEEVRAADVSSIPKWSESIGMEGGSVSGRDPQTLPAFYSCVRVLADTISSLKIKAYREQDNARMLVSPQPLLLGDTPYPDMTWFTWIQRMVRSLAITGNGFGLITARDKLLRPTAILPIHPDHVRIDFPKTGQEIDFLNPIYFICGKKIPTKDIVHIQRYPEGNAVSLSPIEKMRASVDLGLSAEQYGLRWFRDSANPSGLLSTDLELTDAQVKRTQFQWLQANRGRRLPAVMSGGMTWTPISISPNESQFLETRAVSKSDMEMFFGIPPHMLMDTTKSTSWGTGIEEQSIGFVVYTLTPWLECIEQVISLYIPRGQFAKFNVDGLLRGDAKARWEAYELGRNAGVYSVNDIRAMEDLPPVPDGDGRIQPMNFAPLGYVPPAKPAPAPTTRNNPPIGEKEEL